MKIIHWNSISKTDSGEYLCQAFQIRNNTYENRTFELEVNEAKQPEIVETNIENGLIVKYALAEQFQLNCKFNGLPNPKITWLKDNEEIMPEEDDKRIEIRENNTVLNIQYLKAEDAGKYKCLAQNRNGSAFRETALQITSENSSRLFQNFKGKFISFGSFRCVNYQQNFNLRCCFNMLSAGVVYNLCCISISSR